MKIALQTILMLALAALALWTIKQYTDHQRQNCEQELKGFYFKGRCIKDYKIID